MLLFLLFLLLWFLSEIFPNTWQGVWHPIARHWHIRILTGLKFILSHVSESEITNHAALELFTGDAAWHIVKRAPRNDSMVHLSLLSFEPLSLEHWANNHTDPPWHKVPMHCKNDQCQCQCLCLYTSMISGFKTWLNIIGKSTHGLKDPAVCSPAGGWPGNFMICYDSMWRNLEWNHLASSQLDLIDQHIKIFKQLKKHWQCKFPSRLRHAPAKVLPINRLKKFFLSLFAPFSHVWSSSHQSGTSLAAAFPAVNLAWFMIKFHDFQFLCLSLSLFIAMSHSFCLLHLWNLWHLGDKKASMKLFYLKIFHSFSKKCWISQAKILKAS